MADYIILTCKYSKEGNKWVGIAEELGTSMFGRTLDKAKLRLEEAVELHLNTLERVGERTRFFAENNIVVYHTRPRKRISVSMLPQSGYFIHPCVHKVRELIPA